MSPDSPQEPMKVVDRRRWAHEDSTAAEAGPTDGEAPSSLKPTYVEELERQLADKNLLLQEYMTRLKAASGEFDDARARLRREQAKEIERGRRVLLVELLDVVDNLDRAIDAARRHPNAEVLLQGVELVRSQFLGKLDGFGVKRLEPVGELFDPARHDAVASAPVEREEQDGTVVGIVKPGYLIGDDVLRPALVAVGRRE